jgi:integrase
MDELSELPTAIKVSHAPALGIFNPEGEISPKGSDPEPATPAATPRRRGKRKASADRDFPLWQWKDGRWCRKIKGRVYYFGADKEQARAFWLDQKDDLLAGRTPRVKADGLTVADLCNRFLTSKRLLVQSGELSPRTCQDYHQACARLVGAFGKHRFVVDLAADDFDALRAAFGKTRGLVGIANAIRMTRIICKYAVDAGLIERPVRFGPTFRIPSRKNIHSASAGKPLRMFEAVQIRKMIKASGDVMQAMILLGLNCGFGQTDIANLPQSALNLKSGWVDFPRVKTGSLRRISLWPETLSAIRKALALRSEPKDPADADMVFITKYGRRWTRASDKGGPIDGIAQEFGKLLGSLKPKRKGLAFYGLRHTFGTISSNAADQVATTAVMGHLPADHDVPGRYREYVADERLQAVVDHVRAWLFPKPARRKPKPR